MSLPIIVVTLVTVIEIYILKHYFIVSVNTVTFNHRYNSVKLFACAYANSNRQEFAYARANNFAELGYIFD